MLRTTLIAGLLIASSTTVVLAAEADQQLQAVGEAYTKETLPLLKTFCLDCHSTENQEGELDLERFAALDDVRRSASTWVKVAEMLDNGEMPPKDAEQPSAAERKQ